MPTNGMKKQAFEKDIEREEAIEQAQLARQYEEKVLDHEVTPDMSGQATLWPTKE